MPLANESSALIPDLLSHVPTLRLDAAALKQTLTFAFASGVPGTVFEQALGQAALPASTWDPRFFARELFLDDFVATCFAVKIEGHPFPIDRAHLVRVLSHPPSDQSTVEFRRDVFRELESSEALRRGFEGIYASLAEFRSLLEVVPMSRRVESNRRRLDILSALKSGLDGMAEKLDGASSGLARLRELGAEVRAGEAYRRLSDLLEFEDHLSTLDVRVKVGFDGRVRALTLVAARENEENRFYASPLGRFFDKLSLLLRGYRFSEQEVLARLIDGVFDGLEDELVKLFQLIADMEFYLAGLAFRDLATAQGLRVCLPELGSGGERAIRDLWNPLLLPQTPAVVVCDVMTDRHDTTVIVTGPNSGGKTRLLQSVALVQLLGQSGFYVPAREARLALTSGLFVSFIEEARADQSEGRLGMELVRIRSLFERLRVGAMVILDELCSGTNPSEGEEIFELVVTLLAELDPQAFITTHFLQLAARISRERPVPRLAFLQVELDAGQWPTYRFVPGVAETSLAHRTAARLGVTREELLSLVAMSKRAQRA
jgi:DNA mismatch repair protein MutS2